ncbi:MAG: hypothetical protein ACI8W3_002749 [Myxococcota bacterium]|jgi:hypothetical protein
MTPRTANRTTNFRALFCILLSATVLGCIVSASATADNRMGTTHEASYEASANAPTIEVATALDMRDDGYNSDYIFGMTKGVADSTIIGAVKPLFMLVTIPLDLVFLPFAAIGGFF